VNPLEEKDIQILKAIQDSEARMIKMFQDSEAKLEARMDKKIEALRAETNEKFEALDKKIEDTAAQVQRNTAILMDAEFSRRFDLIEEQLQLLMEKMTAPARVEKLEDDMTVVKASIRNLSGRVQTLEDTRNLQ
jgi:predicted  nucleic acid-binding Zn-ribbon protein